MIIVQLKGGLGNQLFQYAAALSLATYHNVEVKVDVSELKRPDDSIGTVRNFELQHLKFPPKVASEEEIKEVKGTNLLRRYYEKTLQPYKRKVYKEEAFAFDRNFFKAGSHIYLKGYRQSEKYFSSIKPVINEQFVFQDHLIQHVAEFGNHLQEVNSVAVHIRRGDYTNKKVAEYHGVLEQSYYHSAMSYMDNSVSNPLYFIFSDDVSWVKQHLNFNGSVEFVSGSITNNQYEDFYLMSQCRNNIIANSSFSWWSAWLNEYPGKKVVAPKKWFQTSEIITSDLYPKEWIVV